MTVCSAETALAASDGPRDRETCVAETLGPKHTQSLAHLFACATDRAWLFPQSSYIPTAQVAAKRWCDRSATTALDLLSYVADAPAPVAAMRMRDGEIAYFVAKSYRQDGIASRALAALICAAQNIPTPQLTAKVQRENIASRSLLEKAGFEFSGLMSTHGPCGALLTYRLRLL